MTHKDIGTALLGICMLMIVAILIAMPQYAYDAKNGLIAINSGYSCKLLGWNCVGAIAYVFAILLVNFDSAQWVDVEYIYKRRVPISLCGIVCSLVFWSISWMGYISRQTSMIVRVPGWGEYELIGPRIFWLTVLMCATALFVITLSIERDIASGKEYSFERLLHGPD